MARRLQVAFIFAVILVLVLPATALADDIIHTVQPGENLFRIGLRYGISWKVIMQANGLTSTNIYVGQQLRIPVGGSSAVTVSDTSAAALQPAASAATSGTYTVVKGDTLRIIAEKFGVSTSALATANNIADPNRIYYGQVFTIPGANTTAAPAPAAPVSTGGSKLVVIDISEQHMYVYNGGALIWSWVASTGERGRETRTGDFSVLNKIPNAYASLWDLQMPYWLGIYWAGASQNGIHALPILSNGQQLWAGYLGTPVSYGCVILGREEARTLYEWVDIGTPVRIQW